MYSLFHPGAHLPRNEIQRNFPPSSPWWNDECQTAVDKRKEATSAYFRRLSIENYISYKHIDPTVQKPSKSKREKAGKNFALNSTSKPPLLKSGP